MATCPTDWEQRCPTFDADATARREPRRASAWCINALAPHVPELIGGSADLAGSNLTDREGRRRLFAPSTAAGATSTSASASTPWAPS